MQFHPDEVGLLAAIHANPREDTPRLAYAEWLELHGQPEFAEFIRLQCVEPCFGIRCEPPDKPDISVELLPAYTEPTLEERATRLLALAPHTVRVKAPFEFRETLYRGLPITQVEADARQSDVGTQQFLDWLGPAVRLDLTIRSLKPQTQQLSSWLSKPIMERVDMLRIIPDYFDEPDYSDESERSPGDISDHFKLDNILALADSPIIRRLYELNLKGDLLPDAQQAVIEFLEPLVLVTYYC